MNCEHVKEDLSAYLDNALRLEEREYVAAHIKTCQSCKRLLADFAHFDVLLAQQPRVIPKPGLRERIFASQEYLELIDSTHRSGSASTPDDFLYPLHGSRPRFVSLPGGRQTSAGKRATLAETLPHPVILPKKKYVPPWQQHVLYGMIAAGVLLSLGIGSLISWRHWQEQARQMQRQLRPQPLHNNKDHSPQVHVFSFCAVASSGAGQETEVVVLRNSQRVQLP